MATIEQLVPIKTKAPDVWDVERIRKDFPVLSQMVHGNRLVYLDNAASSQVPQMVIERGMQYLKHEHSNIHRGVHYLSMKATNAYEGAREKVKRFVNAADVRECIFVRGATEGINLVMHGYGRKFIRQGDEIIISAMEHHANIVPWQMLCEEKDARLRVIPMNDAGELLLDEYDALLNERTKLVAITHVSNALGTVNPIKQMIDQAHKYGVPVLIDGAQSAPHMLVDVQDLDCDFYAFSGHKMFAPTGSGVVYGRAAWLEQMNPFQCGGDMIKNVTFEKTIYADLPNKFEAGTPAIASQIGLGAAIDYLNIVGREKAAAYEHELLNYATERVSFAFYNTREEVDILARTVERVIEIFG